MTLTLQIKAKDGLLSFQTQSAFDLSMVFLQLCCYAQETSECIKQHF